MLIIAEVGPNHRGDMNLAKQLITVAKVCGADIVKFQLYDTDKLNAGEFYQELKKAELSRDQWEEIKKICNEIGIEYLASVFDVERVDWCKDMMRFKVASRSIYDSDLLEKLLTTGKDLIISLGMVDKRGVPKTKCGTKTDYLYCVSKYPSSLSDLRLAKVDFRKLSGYSDHTEGIDACIAAISRGARIIEKHFDLSKRDDDPCNSADPIELTQIVKFARKWGQMC